MRPFSRSNCSNNFLSPIHKQGCKLVDTFGDKYWLQKVVDTNLHVGHTQIVGKGGLWAKADCG